MVRSTGRSARGKQQEAMDTQAAAESQPHDESDDANDEDEDELSDQGRRDDTLQVGRKRGRRAPARTAM